eukprot:sb/3467047/
MLKRLSGNTEYEIRIVTLQTEDSVSNCSFVLSQCSSFTTAASTTVTDLEMHLLDRETIQLSWSALDSASQYEIQLNDQTVQTTSETFVNISLSDLQKTVDVQSFSVRRAGGPTSEPISFSREEFLAQLAATFNTSPLTESPLDEEFSSRSLVRVTSTDSGFEMGRLFCVEKTESGDWCTRIERQQCVLSREHVTCVQVERTVVALYDYEPNKMSPNHDPQHELEFHAGDVILVYNLHPDEPDFYQGALDNRVGLVPSNFVLDLEAVYTKCAPETTPTSQMNALMTGTHWLFEMAANLKHPLYRPAGAPDLDF